jgi:hypothetical protein
MDLFNEPLLIRTNYAVAHEVGHALVAYKLGLKIEYISLGLLKTDLRHNPHVALAHNESNDDIVKVIAFFYGGTLGVEYFHEKNQHLTNYSKVYDESIIGHDVDDKIEIGNRLKSFSLEKRGNISHSAKFQAKKIIERNEELFDLMCNEIRVHKTLTGDQLNKIIDSSKLIKVSLL